MTPIRRFELRGISKPDEPARSELHFDSTPTSTRVDGLVLEAQFETGDGYLLMTTDDCPMEEGLHVILLDKNLEVADDATLAQAYATGTLQAPRAVAPDCLQFSFFGDDEWRVKVLPPPGHPMIALLSPVSRSGSPLRRRRLEVVRMHA